MFKTKDNHQLKLQLDNLQNSIDLSKRYSEIVNSLVKEEATTTNELLKSTKPKSGSQEVQKLMNKILDMSKNNNIELEEKQNEIEKMKKSIEMIKQQNLRNDIKETENINKTIDEMTKAEPLLNYYYDGTETEAIKSFKNVEKRAEEIINTDDSLTQAQKNEIDRLMNDLMETRTMTISKGDAKSFKNGAKMYESILNKISAIKGEDAYSPIKITNDYLPELNSEPEEIDNNVYDYKEEIKYLLKTVEDKNLWNRVMNNFIRFKKNNQTKNIIKADKKIVSRKRFFEITGNVSDLFNTLVENGFKGQNIELNHKELKLIDMNDKKTIDDRQLIYYFNDLREIIYKFLTFLEKEYKPSNQSGILNYLDDVNDNVSRNLNYETPSATKKFNPMDNLVEEDYEGDDGYYDIMMMMWRM
jgi:hypothetical protein